jgi:glycine oxidase
VTQDQVTRLEQAAGRVTGVRGREFYAAPEVVIAAGAWSGGIDGMPRPLSVEPVRGQMAALPWPIGVPPAIMYNRDCYLVYRDGEALIGSTMEYAGFDFSTTAEGIAQIRSAVSAMYPQLSSLTVRRIWAGLRPVSPDGRPIVGGEPRLPGLWYATGHGRNGILLAGITGVMIRELLDQEEPREELDALRADRFWRW